MNIFSWVSAILGFLAIMYLTIYSQSPAIGLAGVSGWVLCLIWVGVGSALYQKLTSIKELADKARTQNAEFASNLINTLKMQTNEIQCLQEEKLFLMITLDKYSKGNGNEKN